MNIRQTILACVVTSSALLLATLPQVSLAENARASQPAGAKQKIVLTIIVVFIFISGVYPKPVFNLTADTVTTILGWFKK